MRHRRLSSWILVSLCFAWEGRWAEAQKALQTDRLTQGNGVLAALAPLVQPLRHSVVVIRLDEQAVALGTVVSPEGFILTKASEVDPLRQLKVQRGRETFSAKVLGWSEAHDVALLSAGGSGWTPVSWDQEMDPDVGQVLVSPGPEKLPLCLGVVSVPRRAIEADQIHGVLGIELDMSRSEAVIRNIFDNSAAAQAGMQVGDTVVRVGNLDVQSASELIGEIRKHPPGETLSVEIRRNNQLKHLHATLTHPFGDFLSRIAQQNRLGGRISSRSSGFSAVIQHDSVLKPEECGGPVLNLQGHVVGMNIARSGRTESLMLPASVIRDVLQAHQLGQLPRMPSVIPKVPPPPPAPTPVQS